MKINPTAAYQAYNKISDYGHTLRRTGAAGENEGFQRGKQPAVLTRYNTYEPQQ